MGVRDCNDIISVWTVGYAGQCALKEFGFRIGVKGYKRVVLQVSTAQSKYGATKVFEYRIGVKEHSRV